MAGFPPGGPGPMVPRMGAAPGPQMPPPGAMPPPPPQVNAPPPPQSGPGPASALGRMLSDLSPHMGPGWQQVDLATSALRMALRSVEFQEMPATVAVLQSVIKTLTTLLSDYTSGSSGGSASPQTSSSGPAEGTPSTDADAQPSAGEAADDMSDAG